MVFPHISLFFLSFFHLLLLLLLLFFVRYLRKRHWLITIMLINILTLWHWITSINLLGFRLRRNRFHFRFRNEINMNLRFDSIIPFDSIKIFWWFFISRNSTMIFYLVVFFTIFGLTRQIQKSCASLRFSQPILCETSHKDGTSWIS